ncbi:MAG TPA: ATP-dependent metallopeptidase FtsH/Yme1/Tma family protein, partial [Acetobacterium sp.]
MNKYLKMIGFYLAILIIIIVAVTFLNPTKNTVKTIVYSELLTDFQNNQVAEIEINNASVTGLLRNGDSFEAVVPQYIIDQQVTPYVLQNDVKVTITKQQDSWWISLIPSVVIIILMVVFFLVFSQQA